MTEKAANGWTPGPLDGPWEIGPSPEEVTMVGIAHPLREVFWRDPEDNDLIISMAHTWADGRAELIRAAPEMAALLRDLANLNQNSQAWLDAQDAARSLLTRINRPGGAE